MAEAFVTSIGLTSSWIQTECAVGSRVADKRGRVMNGGAGIASFSIGISLPQLLTFFVVVIVLFGLAKLWWSK